MNITNNVDNTASSQDDDENTDNISNDELVSNWQQVNLQVKQACDSSSDNNTLNASEKVTLLAVSKTKPAAMIVTLAKEGQHDFGENYLQEAIEKIAELRELSDTKAVVWHYIGRIQRNKTRDIAEHFDWVQTLERDIIAKRLNDQRPEDMPALNVLIQVNIDEEASKSGCHFKELPELIDTIKSYSRLQLRGLMVIPSKNDTNAFARTQQLFKDIKKRHPELEAWDTLSMGMSGDMKEAINHGSTMVRVGTAIFGARD